MCNGTSYSREQSASFVSASSEHQCSRCHPPHAEDLTPELDDDRVDLIQAARVLAMLDDVDDLLGNTLGDRLRLVSCPFELAVEFTRRSEDGQLANSSSQPSLVPGDSG
jgi:hypothetical protein